MQNSVYQYRSYKKFLLDWLDASPRGQRKALSNAIGCQVSHISNVFAGTAHFSPEQAEACAQYLGLNTDETDFFLNLLQLERSGTVSLKKLLAKLLEEKRARASSLKNRLKMPKSLDHEHENRYYSSWQFGAVHVLLSIPEFQTREAIAKKLQLPLAKVSEILEFLEKSGLCEKNGSQYKITQMQTHLGQNSNLISQHHINWRLRTIQNLENLDRSDLHYSAVVTLSPEDFEKISEIMKKSLSDSLKVVTSSPEKEAAVLCVDLFKL